MANTDNDQVKEEAQRAAESGIDLRNVVRNITLNALTKRQLDKEAIRSVIHAVTDGVSLGLGKQKEKVDVQLKQAIAGIDDALSKSAEAAKLATEEVITSAKEYSQKDLKAAISELQTLEDLFIDTVSTVAKQSTTVVSGILKDLSAHLKNTGTATGAQARDAVQALQSQLAASTGESVKSAANAGRSAAQQIAQVAAGILSGMADALSPRDKK